MKRIGIILGIVVFVVLNVLSGYLEDHADIRDYTALDGTMVQELQKLDFPEKFEIVRFGVFNVDNESRGLACAVKSESLDIYDCFYKQIEKEGSGWEKISKNSFKKNKMKLSILKNDLECILNFVILY